MPDHIHLFCAPNRYPEEPLRSWVAYWKSIVARDFPSDYKKGVWQRDFWDRQLRSGESYSEKWAYTAANPVRANLCKQTNQWPHAGELNKLMWHN